VPAFLCSICLLPQLGSVLSLAGITNSFDSCPQLVVSGGITEKLVFLLIVYSMKDFPASEKSCGLFAC
jgi:hypothetical protein